MNHEEIQALVGLSPEEIIARHGVEALEEVLALEMRSGGRPGELPFGVAQDRERVLESPSYLATGILDPWYEKHFEPIHYDLMDNVLAPWLIGETVRIEGVNYDPSQYTGLLCLQSRATIKSTILRIMAQWIALYRKLRLGEDSRTMFVHKVLEKAIEHSESIRETAKQHPKWRQTFPEFAPDAKREWDTKGKWRWPCFTNYLATEWSFTCYGETSSKEGGHYTERLIDDWVTEDSATTEMQLNQSYDRFVKMDNLRDRSRPFNPWLAMGTHYHFQDAYKRLEAQGGWLVWRVPGHTGSPKAIFDICSIEDRTEDGRKKIARKLKELEENPPGKLNFPKMLPWSELYRTARATGPHTYNCQILLNPVPEGEQRFDHEALDAGWRDEIPGPDEMWLYVRCDPAISEKRTADETAYVVGGVRWNGERWLLDGWIGREKRPTEIVKTGFTLARKWIGQGYTVKSIGYESVQYQEALAQIARQGVPERDPTYHGESVPMLTAPCPIVSIKRPPDMTKHERILSMDGPITRREVFFWKHNRIGAKVMQQFKNYPFDRFDALDATHDLWIRVQTPPKPLGPELPRLHPLLAALLKDSAEGDRTLVGGHNSVNLTSWR